MLDDDDDDDDAAANEKKPVDAEPELEKPEEDDASPPPPPPPPPRVYSDTVVLEATPKPALVHGGISHATSAELTTAASGYPPPDAAAFM